MAIFTAVIELDPETGLYVASVPGVPGGHTQGASLDEVQRNLREVLELCMEEDAELRASPPRIVAIQQVEVA